MSVWAECLVSIRFDLDIGPKVEYVTPPGALNDAGKQHLLRVAFPDCNPDCGHDFIFFFTTTDCTAIAGEIHSATVADPSHGSTVSKIHGAAYYRQKRDPNVPRGYVQQVVVLLSRVPYLVAHELILRVVVPRFAQCCPLSPDTQAVAVASALSPNPSTFFELDLAFNPNNYTQNLVLDEAVAEIANWPTPHPRVRYEVMLLHQPLAFTTPSRALRSAGRLMQQNAVHRPQMVLDERVRLLDRDVLDATDSSLCSASMAVPLFGVLGDVMHYLTRLWELVMSHEPVCIISNTPSTASAAAVAVASLVLPITFSGALRAYFTVQDEFFGRFSRMGKALTFPQDESIIVAGTNPFLIRSFDGWPTLLAVSDRYSTSTGSFRGLGATSPTAASPASGSNAASPFPSAVMSSGAPGSPLVGHGDAQFASPATATPTTASASAFSAREERLRGSPAAAGTETVTSDYDSGTDVDSDAKRAEEGNDETNATHLPYGCTLSIPSSSSSRTPATVSPLHQLHFDPSTSTRVSVPQSDSVRLSYIGNNTGSGSCGASGAVGGGGDPLHISSSLSQFDDPPPASTSAGTSAATLSPTVVEASQQRNGTPTALAAVAESSVTSAHASNAGSSLNASITTTTAASVFSQADYSAMVASRRIASQSSIVKTNRTNSRSKLQHHIRNYFDSSYPFIIDHEAQTSALYKRLEAVSKIDEGAQRASALMLSEQFATGTAVNGSRPPTSPHAPHAPQQSAHPSAATATPTTTMSAATEHSQFLVADDVVRKFFVSLTREFLSPVTTWFALTTASMTAFHLCDRATADVLLSPESFLQYFQQHHREVAPSLVRKHHSYKTYKTMYERFARGKLFGEYMRQLVQERLRTEMSFFQVEDWAAQFPSDAERVDMFINLYNVVKRELEQCIDPDVILVTTATAVLASMAVFVSEPLRDQFMVKVGDLRL